MRYDTCEPSTERPNAFLRFLAGDGGAVSSDFALLSAIVVSFGTAASVVVGVGAQSAADNVSKSVTATTISAPGRISSADAGSDWTGGTTANDAAPVQYDTTPDEGVFARPARDDTPSLSVDQGGSAGSGQADDVFVDQRPTADPQPQDDDTEKEQDDAGRTLPAAASNAAVPENARRNRAPAWLSRLFGNRDSAP